MKKVLTIMLIVFVCSLNLAYSKPVKKKVQTKHKIELTTKDKFILVGDLYLAPSKTDKPLIVALHSFSLNSSSYSALAQELREKGYNVLVMDLRGHGRSVYNENLKLKSRYKFSAADWQKLPDDVLASISYVKSNYPNINCSNIIMIGADVGASAGVLAGSTMRVKPQKFVMISPMINFKGLYIPVKIATYSDTKFMVLLAKSDKILFNFHTKTPPLIKNYPFGGPGTQLLKANESAISDIVNFIVKP